MYYYSSRNLIYNCYMARIKVGWGGHGKTNFTGRQWEKTEGDKENSVILGVSN